MVRPYDTLTVTIRFGADSTLTMKKSKLGGEEQNALIRASLANTTPHKDSMQRMKHGNLRSAYYY
jgi:hypothetical protein